ncbi:MAG: dienelactone hydrolase family protein [Acidimicrobiia bacterium]
MTNSNTAYFVPAANESGKGPAVLVLHSWWGLSPSIKKICEQLADLGYCAMAPNFFGETATSVEHAQELLSRAEPNEMADLVLSSIYALRTYSDEPENPVAIVGFAMGGSLGLWASSRIPESVKAVVSVYGTQDIDFTGSKSEYLLISASDDEIATLDEMNYTQALIALGDRDAQSVTIAETSHGFADSLDPAYDENAFNQVFDSIERFLHINYLGDID